MHSSKAASTVGRAVAREQLAEPRLGEVARRHHGARVALDEAGQARVAQEDPVRLLVELPLAHDAHRRHQHALVVDLRRVRRDAARPEPADVLVVAEGRGEGDGLSLVEDRHGEHHVLVVLDGAVGDVRVVEPVHVARPHGLERVGLEDRVDHPRAAARDVAGDDAPARVEDADEVVLLLLDERRHRAPLHQELHVVDGRREAAADDLERDGIDGRRALRPVSSARHGRAPGGCCGRRRRGPGSRARRGRSCRPDRRSPGPRIACRARGRARPYTAARRRRREPRKYTRRSPATRRARVARRRGGGVSAARLGRMPTPVTRRLTSSTWALGRS